MWTLEKNEALNLRKDGGLVGAGQALGVKQQPRFAAQSVRIDDQPLKSDKERQ